MDDFIVWVVELVVDVLVSTVLVLAILLALCAVAFLSLLLYHLLRLGSWKEATEAAWGVTRRIYNMLTKHA